MVGRSTFGRLALAAVLLAAAWPAARAQEEVQVLTWWPEHPTKSFFPGKAAAAVLGVRNVGSEPLNVTYAMANLASPYNASMNLFNFTGQYLHDVPLARGAETSAEYSIPFPRQLPPREFVLQMTLFYSVAGQMRSRMFFNETVNVIEEPTLLDIQLLGLYLFGAALLAAAFYWASDFAKSKGWIKKSKPVARPVAVSDNKEEWLRGTTADPKLKKQK